MKAQEIMTKDVLSVHESTSVNEAVQIMAKHNIGALIVQTPRPTFGIFTQGDLLSV
jgi:predicted transcriptional regulator